MITFEVVTSCGWANTIGYLDAPYCKLLERLGRPIKRISRKTRVEWYIEFGDRTEAAIFDRHFVHRRHLPPLRELRRWYIGGEGPRTVELVSHILDQPARYDAELARLTWNEDGWD
jgi:hypothetical protein